MYESRSIVVLNFVLPSLKHTKGSLAATPVLVNVALPAISPLGRFAALASILVLKVPYRDQLTLRETPSHRLAFVLVNADAEAVLPEGGPFTK